MGYIDGLLSLRSNVVKKEKEKGFPGFFKKRNLKILLSNFEETRKQKYQFAEVVESFFRRKINVKYFDEQYMKDKGRQVADFSDNNAVLNGLREDFDMPLWAFLNLGRGNFADYNRPFIYQLKACNLRCHYCYADDVNKNAKEDSGSRFFSIPEILNAFEEYRKVKPLYTIRPSGGEPTLAVEQWLELVKEIKKRGEQDNVYIQGDTNLTTGHFIDFLEQNGEIEKNLLEKVADFGRFGLLCSFKGTDVENFVENTGAPADLFEEQFYTFKKYVKVGIDCYPFLYNPNPKTIKNFLERLASEVSENVYLKTGVFPLRIYEPVRIRLANQGIDVEEYKKKIDQNFARSREKMQEIIWEKYHINYQAFMRTGIQLKAKE